MKKKLMIAWLACSIVSPVYADEDNYCSCLHIQVANFTKVPCILTNQKITHGNLDTPPPLTILPNDSKRFDMSQSVLYGPDIVLSYQCGAESISFRSQQNLCVLEAGDISGAIVHPMPANINAMYTAIPGSFFWSKSGSINWSINGDTQWSE